MYRLVIITTPDPLLNQQPTRVRGDFDYEEEKQAELRALLWLYYCPDDIVMLVELKEDNCDFCGKPIIEKEGWILHQWAHVQTGAYLCWSNDHTKARPKEQV